MKSVEGHDRYALHCRGRHWMLTLPDESYFVRKKYTIIL